MTPSRQPSGPADNFIDWHAAPHTHSYYCRYYISSSYKFGPQFPPTVWARVEARGVQSGAHPLDAQAGHTGCPTLHCETPATGGSAVTPCQWLGVTKLASLRAALEALLIHTCSTPWGHPPEVRWIGGGGSVPWGHPLSNRRADRDLHVTRPSPGRGWDGVRTDTRREHKREGGRWGDGRCLGDGACHDVARSNLR